MDEKATIHENSKEWNYVNTKKIDLRTEKKKLHPNTSKYFKYTTETKFTATTINNTMLLWLCVQNEELIWYDDDNRWYYFQQTNKKFTCYTTNTTNTTFYNYKQLMMMGTQHSVLSEQNYIYNNSYIL